MTKLSKEELLRKPVKDHDQMTEHELRTEVLRLRAKVSRLQKPKVTEEWIEGRAKSLYRIVEVVGSSSRQWIEHDKNEYIHEFKNFIRSLVEGVHV